MKSVGNFSYNYIQAIPCKFRVTFRLQKHAANKEAVFGIYPMDFKMRRGGKGMNPREHR
ncbi:hypothetical protein XIS1_490032 [Xenorhabdus innexi]|uniref:Uncharacterized protein n=1 Tax=Xenorhabdus innexi TaxID=290109 RepID=A0A1N6MYW3_9GAMM|nr:hypothetical protein XIS1_490032 [Xenorhabdus innexi]